MFDYSSSRIVFYSLLELIHPSFARNHTENGLSRKTRNKREPHDALHRCLSICAHYLSSLLHFFWKSFILTFPLHKMSIPGTFDSEVPTSSPQGSPITIATATDRQRDRQSDSTNLYSYRPIDSLDLRIQSVKSQPEIINISSAETSRFSVPDEIDDSDAIFEVSQQEFLNSQRQKMETSQLPIREGDPPSSSQQEYFELRSAQSTPGTPERYAPVTSSSPVHTQETQPMPPQAINSLAPSAQLTSFRMQSPKQVITSTRTTPRKRNIMVKQDSFTIPHLMSPSKSNLIDTNPFPSTPHRHHHHSIDTNSPASINSSPSIYLTARQNVQETTSPRYEIRTSAVKFKGRVTVEQTSPSKEYQTRVIPVKRSIDVEEILDSSDDEEGDESGISIIEITRTSKKPKFNDDQQSRQVVLQVPSSQGASVASSPTRSRAGSTKSSPTKSRLTSPLKSKKLNDSIDKEDEIQDEFTDLPYSELRTRLVKYGLKSTGNGRESVLRTLRQVSQFLSQDSVLKLSQSQNINNSQNIVRTDIFAAINNAVKKNPKLWEKIYTFEPIVSAEINDLLKENNITITPELLKEWCDHHSVFCPEPRT